MYQRKLEKNISCPLEYGLDLFGGKWKSRIICVIAHAGAVRYGQFKKVLAPISDPVLAASLKELSRDGVVARHSYDEIPPRVEYVLTKKGESIVPLLQAICSWSDRYSPYNAASVFPHCEHCDILLAESSQ